MLMGLQKTGSIQDSGESHRLTHFPQRKVARLIHTDSGISGNLRVPEPFPEEAGFFSGEHSVSLL